MNSISISYAQAMEDIHLLRALQGVRAEDGFYIDIGANDPETDSVTKLFYDAGWRGINVDASPQWAAKLQEQRPRDINIEAAVSNVAGPITFFEHPGGLGTTVDSIAESHRTTHGLAMKPCIVQTATLTDICIAHAPTEIHFLKIDVEGGEAAVLSSMDFGRFRPWILCVESHFPMRPDIQVYEDWESGLLAAEYRFAYTDAINRYYVAEEHAERSASFLYPARFYVHANVARRMRELETRVKTLETCLGGIRTIAAAA